MAYGEKEANALKEAISEVKKAQEHVELAIVKEKLAKIAQLLAVVQI